MSKPLNRIETLATAYCDLVEAKLPVVGLHQRQFLNDLKSETTKFLHAQPAAGLEDLYIYFGNPSETANRLAAIISDPESAEAPIVKNCDAKHCEKHDDDKRTDEIRVGLCRSNNTEKFHEIIEAYETANKMADNGASVADISLITGIPMTVLYMGGFGDPKTDMRDFIVPVRYQMTGLIKVKATSTEDAILSAMNSTKENPIPDHAYMVPNKYEICTEPEKISMYTDMYRSGKLGYEPTDSGFVSPLENRDKMLEQYDGDGLSQILDMMGIKIADVEEIDPADFPCINDNDCKNCPVMKLTGGCPRISDDSHGCKCHECAECANCNDDSDTETDEISDQVCFFDDIEELPPECRPIDDIESEE